MRPARVLRPVPCTDRPGGSGQSTVRPCARLQAGWFPIANESGIGSRLEGNLSWVIPAALVAVLVVLYLSIPAFRSFANEAFAVLRTGDLEEIRRWLQQFGPRKLVVIVGILIVQPLLLVVPSVLMMVVAVLAYGPVWGGLLALGGSTGAAILGYGLGWALSPVTVERLVGERNEEKIERYVERYGFWAVALFRVSPVLSTDAISVVAGLLGMHFGWYVAATVAGFLPLAGTIAILGGELAWMERVLVWGSLASVAALAGYIAYDVWRRRSSS